MKLVLLRLWHRIVDCSNCEGSGTIASYLWTETGPEWDVYTCEECCGSGSRFRSCSESRYTQVLAEYLDE